MRQCNVEIFDRALNNISHTTAVMQEYEEDYLSPHDNDIVVLNCDVAKGNYIRIVDKRTEYFGIVNSVASQSEKTMKISYGSFLTLFDTDVLFNTDLQGGNTSLEQTIANLITDMFISNTDQSMVVPGLNVQTQTSTADWGFNLKSDTENKHHCIINFYNVIFVRSLEKYAVRVKVVPDVQNKTINLLIGRNTASAVPIESDLHNVVKRNIVIKETSNDVNKLVVYNTENYTGKRVYYLHPDGSYNMTNDNRILPVVQDIKGTAPEREEDTIKKTFAQMADSEAAEVFGLIAYNNLIELEVANDDGLVKPYALEIGQIANVYSKGNVYPSMLTGKTVKDKTTLIFGTVRVDLTKVLKRRYR